jgi:hypothetical protein
MCESIDDFDDTRSLTSGGEILYEDGGDLKTKGMLFIGSTKKKKNKYQLGSIILQAVGLKSSCVDEGSTLDIIFENGEKIKLTSWNDFNCKGTSYFDLSDNHRKNFSESKIKAVRYTEKKSREKMTSKDEITKSNANYLYDLIKEINEVNLGNLSIARCED